MPLDRLPSSPAVSFGASNHSSVFPGPQPTPHLAADARTAVLECRPLVGHIASFLIRTTDGVTDPQSYRDIASFARTNKRFYSESKRPSETFIGENLLKSDLIDISNSESGSPAAPPSPARKAREDFLKKTIPHAIRWGAHLPIATLALEHLKAGPFSQEVLQVVLHPPYPMAQNDALLAVAKRRRDFNLDIAIGNSTCLNSAIQHQRPLLAIAYIDQGTPVELNSGDYLGRTPLMLAAQENELDVINALLSKECLLGTRDDVKGDTALHYAARSGNADIVIALLNAITPQNTALKNLENMQGESPLSVAASAGHAVAVKAMIELGCDVNARDGCGRTALHDAIRNLRFDVLTVMLESGKVNAARLKSILPVRDMATYLRECPRLTPESILTTLVASTDLDSIAVLTCLLENGLPATLHSPENFSLLHYAAIHGNAHAAAMLLANDAPLSLRITETLVVEAAPGQYEYFDRNMDAMMMAARLGHHQVIDVLLRAPGYSPAQFDDSVKWALLEALSAGHDNVVHTLFAFDAVSGANEALVRQICQQQGREMPFTRPHMHDGVREPLERMVE